MDLGFDLAARPRLPHRAVAKIDMRLVPDMKASEALDALKKHLAKKGFGDIEVNMTGGYDPTSTPGDSALIRAQLAVYRRSGTRGNVDKAPVPQVLVYNFSLLECHVQPARVDLRELEVRVLVQREAVERRLRGDERDADRPAPRCRLRRRRTSARRCSSSSWAIWEPTKPKSPL